MGFLHHPFLIPAVVLFVFFHLFSSSLPSHRLASDPHPPPPRPNTIPFRPPFQPQCPHLCYYGRPLASLRTPPFLSIILTLNSDANPSHLSPSCIYTSSLFTITLFPPHRFYLFVFPVRSTLPGAYSGVAYPHLLLSSFCPPAVLFAFLNCDTSLTPNELNEVY